MFNAPQFARDMKRGEEDAVDALIAAAFDGTAEVALVHKLRKAKLIAGEQVMTMGDSIVGYYALSYLVKPKGWLSLAPVAIAPDVQRRGYGKRMIGMLTEWARLTGTPVVVLGQQAFYEQAGFSNAAAENLTSPYPAEHMGLIGATGAPAQTLVYPPAFGGV